MNKKFRIELVIDENNSKVSLSWGLGCMWIDNLLSKSRQALTLKFYADILHDGWMWRFYIVMYNMYM